MTPRSIETLAQLIARDARIHWFCDVGTALGHVPHHGGEVDLVALSRSVGDDVVLANRRPPCREPGCPGRATFKDMSSAWPRPLDTITDRDAERWAYIDRRRIELMAEGWTLQMGHWMPPNKDRK